MKSYTKLTLEIEESVDVITSSNEVETDRVPLVNQEKENVFTKQGRTQQGLYDI